MMSPNERSGLIAASRVKNQLHHDPVTIVLILTGLVTFVLTAVFNALAGSGAGVPKIFHYTTGEMSDKYEIFITPAGFTFSIWSVIYLWIAASLLIFVATIFISNKSHNKVYLNPPFATPALMSVMSINFLLNLAWIFLWDREYQVVAAIFLFLIAGTNIAVVAIMARNIQIHPEYLKGQEMFAWGIVYRIIMNGFAVYTTWTVIASLINLNISLAYVGGIDMKAASLAALSLLVIFHTTWFITENFLLDRYARWILTPYLVVIWAANGIRAKKSSDPTVPHEVKDFVLAILVIACLTLVVRLILVTYRTIRENTRRVAGIIE